jgi:hypothetical protein
VWQQSSRHKYVSSLAFLFLLGRDLYRLLILGKINMKSANLGSKNAGASLNIKEKCTILMKILIGRRLEIGLC